MPEYLAPGVYVEETSYRAKSIEGVSTTTTGFVGPTRYGPTDRPSDVITSLVEFERIYGGREPLLLGGVETPNFMWHAARAFFEEGGKRLYVSRVFNPHTNQTLSSTDSSSQGSPKQVKISARFLGRAGNYRVSFQAIAGQNILIPAIGDKPMTLTGLTNHDVVEIKKIQGCEVYTAIRDSQGVWKRDNENGPNLIDQDVSEVRVITLKVTITQPDTGNQRVWTGLAPDPLHRRSGTPDSLFDTFPEILVNSSQAASIPIRITPVSNTLLTGREILLDLGCLKSNPLPLGDTTLGEITLDGKRLDQFTLAEIKYQQSTSGTGSPPAVSPSDTQFSAMSASAIDADKLNQVFNSGSVKLGDLSLGNTRIADITLGQVNLNNVPLKDIALDKIKLCGSSLLVNNATNQGLNNTKLDTTDFTEIKLGQLKLGDANIMELTIDVTNEYQSLNQIPLGDLRLGDRKLSSIKLSELKVGESAFRDLTLNTEKLITASITNQKVANEEQLFILSGGTDGNIPNASDIAGQTGETGTNGESLAKSGLKGFEDIEDISIVAAPGSTWRPDPKTNPDMTLAQAVCNALIRHAQKMKYRIAVLDSPLGASIQQVREFRAKFDSSYAALYYPWVRTLDPATNTDILLPPSGFVAGIYARNDINRAVYKAPANEVVTLALGFEHTLNQAHQEVLNPEGINCFRYFEGRGNRLWGARTVSSDPEWKYVNLRRYFAYLERSIDRSSQFAVFEPNGEALWANIRRMVEDFLFSEWQSGALLGDKPEKAFFVRCDRSTMNQNDLDNGRLVCLIGVAPLRPAEFVIFRIGQFTADRR